MTDKNRVVITGLGVCAPNAVGLDSFTQALQEGKSGIRHWKELEDINLKCQIGGKPEITPELKEKLLPPFLAGKIVNKAVIYACISGLEAWQDAGLTYNEEEPDLDSGIMFGSGALGLDSTIGPKIHLIEGGESRKLGSRSIPESMSSGASAFLNSMIGFGNRVLSNSSACTTGSEALMLAYEHIKAGKAKRMLCGSTEGDGMHIWAAFDAMRVLCSDSNDHPEFGSRPMSDTSSGFVPSGGSGAIVVETLESAHERGARIYAEILGGAVNSGGQRMGGTMTAPNYQAVNRCIRSAVESANIAVDEIDLISGHLTSTKNDPVEIKSWKETVTGPDNRFPLINAPKSMIGHCVAGAGSIELVATTLQLHHGFIHPNLNCANIHPEIQNLIPLGKIPTKTVYQPIDTAIKANFGFGDLNCCMVLRKWKN